MKESGNQNCVGWDILTFSSEKPLDPTFPIMQLEDIVHPRFTALQRPLLKHRFFLMASLYLFFKLYDFILLSNSRSAPLKTHLSLLAIITHYFIWFNFRLLRKTDWAVCQSCVMCMMTMCHESCEEEKFRLFFHFEFTKSNIANIYIWRRKQHVNAVGTETWYWRGWMFCDWISELMSAWFTQNYKGDPGNTFEVTSDRHWACT